MGFLRRLLGGGASQEGGAAAHDGGAARDDAGPSRATATSDPEAEERARELELLRADATRLDDELIQRQLRYSDRSWTPPAQGGTRRADDEAGDDA